MYIGDIRNIYHCTTNEQTQPKHPVLFVVPPMLLNISFIPAGPLSSLLQVRAPQLGASLYGGYKRWD